MKEIFGKDEFPLFKTFLSATRRFGEGRLSIFPVRRGSTVGFFEVVFPEPLLVPLRLYGLWMGTPSGEDSCQAAGRELSLNPPSSRSETMKILQVSHGFPPKENAGVELYTFYLSKALSARGHHVSVFCREEDPEKRRIFIF